MFLDRAPTRLPIAPVPHSLRVQKAFCSFALKHCQCRQHSGLSARGGDYRDLTWRFGDRLTGRRIEDVPVAAAVLQQISAAIAARRDASSVDIDDMARARKPIDRLDANLPGTAVRVGSKGTEVTAKIQ